MEDPAAFGPFRAVAYGGTRGCLPGAGSALFGDAGHGRNGGGITGVSVASPAAAENRLALVLVAGERAAPDDDEHEAQVSRQHEPELGITEIVDADSCDGFKTYKCEGIGHSH